MADDSVGRHRLSPNLIAGLLLAFFSIAVVVWQQPWHSGGTQKRSATPNDSTAAANSIAAQIQRLVSARNKGEFVKAAGDSPGGRSWGERTYDNIVALGATHISMDFISGGDSGTRADGGTRAAVSVSWRPGSVSGLAPTQTQKATVTFDLDRLSATKFAVHDVTRDSGRLPMWLAGKLDVAHGVGATVISIDGGNAGQPIAEDAEHAHTAVRKVVTSATERLVIVSPHTQEQAADLVGQKPESIAQIAAVTTTLDGSGGASAATMILLNPMVFDTMDERAAQIVMSHEATHMMTKAAISGLETWVSEGFADYVALHDDKAPLSVSAGQILRSVKKDGAPKAFPTSAGFGTTQHGLGGTYESAWMIFRMLGGKYGDQAVLAFYRDALHGKSTARAAKAAFGLSIAEITSEWRHYLVAKSASITS